MPDEPKQVRLQRFLARAGVKSRRHAEEAIAAGHVAVNGTVVTEMGFKIDPETDVVTFDGAAVSLPETAKTYMLHKPAGFVTSMSDAHNKRSVREFLEGLDEPALYPLGRLDKDTTGLLLFSTDGALGHALLHPSHHVEKCYFAIVEGVPSEDALAALRAGIELDEGTTAPAYVALLEGEAREEALASIGADELASGVRARKKTERRGAALSVLEIRIREGKYRQVRRMLKEVGHPVVSLHRETFGPCTLGDLARGAVRELTEAEYEALYEAAGLERDHGL